MLQHQFNFISNVTKQETHLHMGNYTKLFGGLNDNCYVVKQTKDPKRSPFSRNIPCLQNLGLLAKLFYLYVVVSLLAGCLELIYRVCFLKTCFKLFGVISDVFFHPYQNLISDLTDLCELCGCVSLNFLLQKMN